MPEITKEFLRELITEVVSRINSGATKKLTARKSSEVPPRDTRHLTDTRTRVSSLLEYSLSYELNQLLIENELTYSISNVLWNVFPDLIVRDSNFNNVAGLEVKALHAAAEEKSANLHTPLPLIRKNKDFIVILAWGWSRLHEGDIDITYPHIHSVGIFDAWLIAKMRDSTWLINSNDRVKGIDISTPIISSTGSTFKAEEGNLGKLMRINLSNKTSPDMPYFEDMQMEADSYTSFKKKILLLGLNETIKDILEKVEGILPYPNNISELPEVATVIEVADIPGRKRIHFIAGSKRGNTSWNEIISPSKNEDVIIQLSNKLDWKVIKNTDRWSVTALGKKPDIELEKICNAVLE